MGHANAQSGLRLLGMGRVITISEKESDVGGELTRDSVLGQEGPERFRGYGCRT